MAENDVNRLIDMLYERVEDAKSPAMKPASRGAEAGAGTAGRPGKICG